MICFEQFGGAEALADRSALGEAFEDLGFDAGVIDADRARDRDRQGGEQDQRLASAAIARGR